MRKGNFNASRKATSHWTIVALPPLKIPVKTFFLTFYLHFRPCMYIIYLQAGSNFLNILMLRGWRVSRATPLNPPLILYLYNNNYISSKQRRLHLEILVSFSLKSFFHATLCSNIFCIIISEYCAFTYVHCTYCKRQPFVHI